MLRKKKFSVNILGAAILLAGLGMSGCNNDSKTETSTTSSATDTSAMIKVDPSAPMPSSTTDTSASSTAVTPGTGAAAGTAKPNPAKKGMKGKATITVPTKGTGSMDADNTGVYSNVEYLPSFPGGNKGLQKFFDDNLVYPEDATNEGVDGTVNVTFVVDENGKLTAPQVAGQNLGYGLEAEALRVVSKMPQWNPGKLKGKNVKTRFTLPVVFQLY